MSKLSELEVFVQVVKKGGFTAAASALDVSKSHVSREIVRLEERLGARLLQRTTRRVSLTDVGKAFFDRAIPILDQLEEAELAVSQMQSVPVGTLQITLPSSYGRLVLSPIINDFLTQYPQLNMELTFADRRVDLIAEGIDLAVRIGHLPDSSLFARRLGTLEFVVCASPAYLADQPEITTPGQLQAHACLEFALRYNRDVWSFIGPEGEIRASINHRYLTDQGEALVDAAVKSLGIIYVPEFLVTEHLESGTLTRLLEDYMPPPVPVWAIYPHNRHLSAKVRLLVDYLVDAFRRP